MKNNEEYWRDRFKALEDITYGKSQKCYKNIQQAFNKTENKVKDILLNFFEQFADLENISITEAKKLLSSDELEAFRLSIEEYIKLGEQQNINYSDEVNKFLEEASLKYRVTRLDAAYSQFAAEMALLTGNEINLIEEMLTDVYVDRYYRTAFEIFKNYGVGTSFDMVNPSTLKSILNQPWTVDGQTFSERLWNNQNKLVNQLSQSLAQACVTGEGYTETTEKLSKLLNSTKSNAGRLVVTESAYFSSEAQNTCFKELDVKQYEIIATLDQLTDPECQDLDGKVYKMDEFEVGVTAPPFHPNCRCTTAPYTDDSDIEGYQLGTRTARDKDGKTYRVPRDMKYREWAEKYQIDPVYGKASAKPEKYSIIISNRLKKDYPKWVLDEIEPLYNNAPENIKKAFNACSNKLHCVDINSKENYYSPPKRKGATGAVHINIQKDKEGNIYKNPWSTFAHEHGHNMDYILNQIVGTKKGTKPISQTYKHGALRKAITKDFNNLLKNFKKETGIRRNVQACEKLCLDLRSSLTEKQRNELSDILAGQLQYKFRNDKDYRRGTSLVRWSFPLDVGHEEGYFSLHLTHIENEFFAEVISASVTNLESLEIIKEYFPTGYSTVMEILDLVE